ncbi:MAG: hypothetical protein M1609_02530, partial [Firmicutes bacterium]|nr:hypothetical protein [Bacillota bacterium]
GELHLTGINKNPVAVLVKYVEEINEAAVASQGLMRMVFNLGQVPDKERPAIVALMEQSFYDVKTALARAEISMLEITGVEAGIEARRRHKEKCMARGYLRKEKQPALVAEQQAEYLIS